MESRPPMPLMRSKRAIYPTILTICAASILTICLSSVPTRFYPSIASPAPVNSNTATRSISTNAARPSLSGGFQRCPRVESQRSTSPRSYPRSGRLQAFSSVTSASPAEESSQAKGTILVVGGTGTLGRQIVRRALSDGYTVRCLVRSRFESEEGRRVLQGWGAQIVGGDLGQATSIPPAMLGVDAVIDCATARPEEPLKRVDWDGKVALIETAQAMGVDRYIFFSIDKCHDYPEVKLMDMKAKTEDYLKQTNLNYTVFKLCGFMQALVSSYAIPIVEGENVWGTDSSSKIAYINSVDAARLALASVDNEATHRGTFSLAGPTAYTTDEVIALCEKFSGSDAKVIKAPGFFLQAVRSFLNLFKWAQDAADRLSFSEVISRNTVLSGDMKTTCEVLKIDPESLTSLPEYLESFFNTILSKVQKIKKSEYVSTVARDLEI